MSLLKKNKKNLTLEEQHDAEQYAAWHQEAQQGDAAAQFRIGWMHANGHGVAQDDRRALDWYQKSAAQGFAAAQCNLGWM